MSTEKAVFAEAERLMLEARKLEKAADDLLKPIVIAAVRSGDRAEIMRLSKVVPCSFYRTELRTILAEMEAGGVKKVIEFLHHFR